MSASPGHAPSQAPWALALALAGLTFVISYIAQRLATAATAEPAADLALATEHIPYYWRVAVSAFHAGLVGLLTGLAVSPEAAEVWLGRLPWVVGGVTVAAAAAALAVP